ncbi:hypothetical protein PTRG_08572 [Pyrenophora tritici-repentis Pt-1C-BFP]|uniref:Uncharacterized protein n=1 Tax=Pyrenophora tritici-repentis (strain Pt-1C-BFP) TaxID=426418 RepID=B2WEJ9_PYRTR|nr:uncharacterized protein PTRG_08572 [Pyrenophora tritici-repentis Pt-1C-BFP]EDU51491.1 hypothetical protein PTRG_08572 [Pyrenophora tritici-repentis Pt-1C-BFP]
MKLSSVITLCCASVALGAGCHRPRPCINGNCIPQWESNCTNLWEVFKMEPCRKLKAPSGTCRSGRCEGCQWDGILERCTYCDIRCC